MRSTLLSPASLSLLVALLGGAAAGLGGYTFVYAKGASYLSKDPAACANCHVMQEHMDAWEKSSHHAVATCNDCHMPHDFVGKWLTKAENGFWHSLAFTSGEFPDPLLIKPGNRAVAEASCRHCHADVTHGLDAGGASSCIRCHGAVGHPTFTAPSPVPAR